MLHGTSNSRDQHNTHTDRHSTRRDLERNSTGTLYLIFPFWPLFFGPFWYLFYDLSSKSPPLQVLCTRWIDGQRAGVGPNISFLVATRRVPGEPARASALYTPVTMFQINPNMVPWLYAPTHGSGRIVSPWCPCRRCFRRPAIVQVGSVDLCLTLMFSFKCAVTAWAFTLTCCISWWHMFHGFFLHVLLFVKFHLTSRARTLQIIVPATAVSRPLS